MNEFSGQIAILGSGNIGTSLAKGLVKANYANPGQICLTRRNVAALSEFTDLGYQVTTDPGRCDCAGGFTAAAEPTA
jgi:pyrroline-5-carboxylate reductase